jgi:putative phosphoribosyl transferase
VKQRDARSISVVSIPVDAVELRAQFQVPNGAAAAVLLTHAGGGSRRGARRNAVAGALHKAGIATLSFGLLTEREAADRANVFNVDLLVQRLGDVAGWLRHHEGTEALRLGYFGAGTGAAAALIAAAEDPTIRAVVSYGGRPDLAASALLRVRAPTLLIVGDDDIPMLRSNEHAYAQLHGERALRIMHGAGQLAEAAGAGEDVARCATEWFVRYLKKP